MSEQYGYILLEAEKWWNKRRSQSEMGKRQHAFVRRGKVGPLTTEILFFYVNKPAREIRSKAEFIERVTGKADALWDKYGVETVFESYSEYKEFVGGREDITFIRFKNLQELIQPVSAKIFLERTGGSSMLSRNGRYISKDLAITFI